MKWENLTTEIPKLLEKIHDDMYERAVKTRDEHLKDAFTWEEFMTALNGRNIVLTPWCYESECEK